MKKCPRCSQYKEITEFHKNSATKSGLAVYCKPCNREVNRLSHLKHREKRLAQRRIWRAKNIDVIREKERAYNKKMRSVKRQRDVERRYGITQLEYEAMLEKQDGVCAICGNGNNVEKRMCIDHDHDAGNVRGILCDRCNNLLGRALDDTEILRKAIEYLDKHNNS